MVQIESVCRRQNKFNLKTEIIFGMGIESLLPNDKFFDWSKLKAFVDNKKKLTQKQKFFFRWVEKKKCYQMIIFYPGLN